MPKTITVMNMPRASHLADGSLVEMEFAGSNGEKFALRFSPDKLERFVEQARQLLVSARSQKLRQTRGRTYDETHSPISRDDARQTPAIPEPGRSRPDI
jgi:hypothetical protein